MKTAIGKFMAGKDRHIGLSLLIASAFAISCSNDVDAFVPSCPSHKPAEAVATSCSDDEGNGGNNDISSSSAVLSSSGAGVSSSSSAGSSSSTGSLAESSSSSNSEILPSSSSEEISSSSSVEQSSSSGEAESSSSAAIVYGETVTFHGEEYPTVAIGAQTWFAKNLNYDAEGSRCYDDDEDNCAKYGRLYDWVTVMDFSVCPDGWHIPNNEEWSILINYVDGSGGSESHTSAAAGKYLKAANGWNDYEGVSGNGTDDFGFAALPGGVYADGGFRNAGSNSYWWSATEFSDNRAYLRYIYYDGSVIYSQSIKANLHSIRCIKD